MNAPLLSNDELNAKLAASIGERVTKEYIESRIAKTEYYVWPDSTLMICRLTLDSGFSVTGESACVDPANFDKAIGERIAHDNAFNKLWPLLGFLLAEKRLIAVG